MTNHPNRGRTYWQIIPRGFANEYTIGIATTKAAAEAYELAGYSRVKRDYALRELAYSGDAATDAYVTARIDGAKVAYRDELLRAIRSGSSLDRIQTFDD